MPCRALQGRPRAVAILYDAGTVLANGRSSLLLALADARRMVQAAAGGPAPEGAAPMAAGNGSSNGAGSGNGGTAPAARAVAASSGVRRRGRAQLAAAERKLWFFLLWANEQDEGSLAGSAQALLEESQRLHELVVAGGVAAPRGAAGQQQGLRYK